MSQVVSFSGYTPPARFDATPWESVKIEEAATDSGPWTLIDTITFASADADPTQPQARNITTSNATAADDFFRLTFVDGDGGTSHPSSPIRYSIGGTAFATADDFADRIGIVLTAGERTRATALLERAAQLIRDEIKQDLDLVVDDTLTMPGTNDDRILLPERPVVSVSRVTLGGSDLAEGTDWFLNGNEIIRLASSFVQGLNVNLDEPYLLGTGTGFGRPSETLTIVYTHGYEDVPEIVRTVSLEAVGRVWVNPGAVARETVGDTSTVYDNNRFSPSGLLLTDVERQALRRFFGRRAISITIGG